MRHQYTPIFRETLTSRIWALPDYVLRVWMWFQLTADPEGYVPASVHGVAIGARVSEDEARQALRVLESEDPDADEDDENEGRELVRQPKGWFVIGAIENRKLAKVEAEKARKRRYMKERRGHAPVPTSSGPVSPKPMAPATSSGPVDASIATPKSNHSSEGVIPPTPRECGPLEHTFSHGQTCERCGKTIEALRAEVRARFDAAPAAIVTAELPPPPGAVDSSHLVVRTYTTLDGMDETGLEDEAVMVGMSREWFRERLAAVRNTTIGGRTGVRNQRDWVRNQFGRWRTWEEQERAKNAAATGKRGDAPPPPKPKAPEVPGCPRWVTREHADLVKALGLPLKRTIAAFARSYHHPVDSVHPNLLAQPFEQFIREQAAEGRAA